MRITKESLKINEKSKIPTRTETKEKGNARL